MNSQIDVAHYINIDKVVEILQVEIEPCWYLPKKYIKTAFVEWLKSALSAIDEDPQWFVENLQSKQFFENLPEDDEFSESDELADFDTEFAEAIEVKEGTQFFVRSSK